MSSFKQKLYHNTPSWVSDSAVFHIRIRCSDNNPRPLTDEKIGPALLASVQTYTSMQLWSCYLVVVMPDHLHALLSFNRQKGMSQIIRNWKRYHASKHDVIWQDNYFDHRIRNEQEFKEKYAYIESNPVAKNLCATREQWPWKMSSWQPGTHIRFD